MHFSWTFSGVKALDCGIISCLKKLFSEEWLCKEVVRVAPMHLYVWSIFRSTGLLSQMKIFSFHMFKNSIVGQVTADTSVSGINSLILIDKVCQAHEVPGILDEDLSLHSVSAIVKSNPQSLYKKLCGGQKPRTNVIKGSIRAHLLSQMKALCRLLTWVAFWKDFLSSFWKDEDLFCFKELFGKPF